MACRPRAVLRLPWAILVFSLRETLMLRLGKLSARLRQRALKIFIQAPRALRSLARIRYQNTVFIITTFPRKMKRVLSGGAPCRREARERMRVPRFQPI